MNIAIFLSKIFTSLGYISNRIAKKIYTSPQKKEVVEWFKIHGDKTLRLQYNLDSSSLVFDLGGYWGQWASDIFAMYGCTIHVFEPVMDFAERIEKRFSGNKKIFIHRFGLSNENRLVKISFNEDSSSIYKPGNNYRNAHLLKATDFIKERHIERIHLMKINIEGGEYDLLEHLIFTGYINKINDIQVQFHDFIPNAEQKMLLIQNELEKTHRLTYQYPFVWENWSLKLF